jgi:hypothetical protein
MDSTGAERGITDDLQSHLLAFPLSKLANQPHLLLENHTRLCETLDKGLDNLSDTITERFFSHATRSIR